MMVAQTLFTFVILAILIERVVEMAKPIWDKSKNQNPDVWYGLGFAVMITVLSGQDLFTVIGIPLRIPGVVAEWNNVFGLIIGTLLTGIILSGGSGIVHDIIKTISGLLKKDEA